MVSTGAAAQSELGQYPGEVLEAVLRILRGPRQEENGSDTQWRSSPRRVGAWYGARTTGSAGAPRQSRTWLISLRTNPAESTTSFRD